MKEVTLTIQLEGFYLLFTVMDQNLKRGILWDLAQLPLNQSSLDFKIEEQKLLVKGYSSKSLRKPHAAILACL